MHHPQRVNAWSPPDQQPLLQRLRVPVVLPRSPGEGKSLDSLQLTATTGASVLAVVRAGTPMPNPRADFVLAAGDLLLLLGTDAQLRSVETTLSADQSQVT